MLKGLLEGKNIRATLLEFSVRFDPATIRFNIQLPSSNNKDRRFFMKVLKDSISNLLNWNFQDDFNILQVDEKGINIIVDVSSKKHNRIVKVHKKIKNYLDSKGVAIRSISTVINNKVIQILYKDSSLGSSDDVE